MQIEIAFVETPVGRLALAVADGSLVRVDFGERKLRRGLKERFGEVTLRERRDPCGFAAGMRAYLRGDLGAIDEFRTDTGGTEFQRKVWKQLRRIPHGKTISYGELARRIGRPTASRAVGLANGSNPISVVIPCHRVIGADGRLTGYGGGLPRKEWLLRHEGAVFRTNQTRASQSALPFNAC